MSEVDRILDGLMAGGLAAPIPDDEFAARTHLLGVLFVSKGAGMDDPRIEIYQDETEAIPLFWWRLALAGLTRSHKWPGVPFIADIWLTAHHVAGMHRDRYHAGHYLPPTKEWPPDGMRHGIPVGEFERVTSTAVLGAGDAVAQISEGNSTEGGT